MKLEHWVAAAFCTLAFSTASYSGTKYRRNTAPSITGTPPNSVSVGASYSFRPTAVDPNRDRLRFYIKNKPTWAMFNSSNGTLSGTPSDSQVGTYPGIQISVSDGRLVASLPTFSVAVTSSPPETLPENREPVISGLPSTNVVAGRMYSFLPSSHDPDGDQLSFSISGKPAWAAFGVSSGSLTGTPSLSQTGTYGEIVISVSDGVAVRSLPAFGITVSAPAASGTAILSWSPPTQNTDGSLLTNLAGYRVYHGTEASSMSDVRSVSNPAATSYQFTSLGSGTHYFAVSAYSTDGSESSLSNIGSKSVP